MTTPEPKSSSETEGAGATLSSVPIFLERVDGRRAGVDDGERGDVRRRGRSLVPSESELLVGIDVT
ncbi:MAG: hypothetical protein NT138_15900 [Planctomycetales bacterium]|nr:hypothetical protein [Planctomycetales bacterium]